MNLNRFDGASDEAFDTEGLARRRTNKSGVSIPSMDIVAKSHTSRMRTGLGTAMYHVASAPDAIKEVLSPGSVHPRDLAGASSGPRSNPARIYYKVGEFLSSFAAGGTEKPPWHHERL